ncbi:venom serine protease-like [Schistocerca nitens]|uniref:venom serine protease-like n=1 Tax=Schistocerca nitens TaxID=7011 RepID=UPI0021198561|nr:venom serine protease-like [Schistocerca nitens]XP_049806162.1 venom serine protease-like [Schistocerca nitens]XP_049806171.1 venom serine protease-like [Schistocerca nitens]
MREALWLVVVAAVAGAARGQNFTGCDLYQEVTVGTTYTLYSPLYPNYFQGAYACRWSAVTDAAAKIVLSCDPFSLPATGQCDTARLSVSTSGDASLSDAHLYCGEGSFSQSSDANRLVVALQTAVTNAGSRFSCTITAVQQQQPAPADCTCGVRKQTRIVNGKETGVNEYPMMAGLVDLEQEQVVCGASIISTRHAVTAAHCLLLYTADTLALLVGDHNIATGTDTDKAALYRLQQLVAHPDYEDSTHLNDIGVVRVVGQITYNVAVGPVCLPFLYTYTDFQGVTVQALGWGTTSFGGPLSDVLMETNLTVISPSACDSNAATAEYRVCTYRNGTDACQSDSGGPLLWQDPYSMRLQLVGIISYGSSCAVSPATNTRVTAYLQWIAQVTQDTFCIA